MEQKNDFQFDDRTIQTAIRKIDRDILVIALSGTDNEVKEKFYRNMSPRAAVWLREQDGIYTYTVKEREEARQKIIATVRSLEDSENGDTQADESAAEDEAASLIRQIEDAIEKNGELLYMWHKNPADITKAFAAFEGRAEDLRRIRGLHLCMNEFDTFSPLLRVGALERMTVYNSYGRDFETPTLPESLGVWPGLKYLYIAGLIQTLPEWIGGFASLSELSLNGTKITALPQSMRNLTALERLDLGGSGIKELPEWIGGFASLTELSLNGTKITALPQSMRNLAALKRLDLGGLGIKELPEWIGGLASLTELSLKGTKIAVLPQSMRNLAALERLNITCTNIRCLPEWLAGLAGLKTIDIHGTGIQDIPAAFTGNGNRKTPITILREIEFMPDHKLNYDEFVSCYYFIVYESLEFLEKARREGLTALEKYLKDYGDRDLFRAGLSMAADGNDPSIIREILTNLVEREHDPYKRRLKRVQTEAVLSIQNGEGPEPLLRRLDSVVDIPDNRVRAVCASFYHEVPCSSLTEALSKALGETMDELYAKIWRRSFIENDFWFEDIAMPGASEDGDTPANESAAEDDSPVEDKTAYLIGLIEEAIERNEPLSLHCDNPDSMAKALAAFESRANDLRRIRELRTGMSDLEAVRPLLCVGALERLVVWNDWKRDDEAPTLPESLRACSGLEYLYVSADIQTLPEWIGGFASLKELLLSRTKIAALPQSLRNLAALERLDIRYTNIRCLPEWLADLASLKTIDIHGTEIEDIPAAFMGNGNRKKTVPVLRGIEFMPDRKLNYDEFVSCYYYIVHKSLEFLEKVRSKGLLALDEIIYSFGDRDLFKTGLRLVVDENDPPVVREILANLVDREHDPYKRRLKQIQTEAILSIQGVETPERLLLHLNSMVDIPDNKVNAACAAYYQNDSCSLDDALGKAFGEKMHETNANPCRLPPAEREEIRFMLRAMSFVLKARHEGLPALESERDPALFARRDVFEYGIVMVIDGEEPEFIKTILDALIEHEYDPWKRKLMAAKRDAVLSIQAGDDPRLFIVKMLAHFDQSIGSMFKAEWPKA